MTIMTPMEGLTAPRHPSTTPTETFLPQDETPLLSSRRQDGWSAANQRLFLEAIAEGHGVEQATYRVGLSAASAYAFRRTAKGAAFALGWRAATLVARECVADTLMARALGGQVDTYTRADGSIVTRHRHDNRLALTLLARLDRQVESAPDADVKAARLVAQDFDAFLDLVGKDAGPARAGLFLARRAGQLGLDEDGDSAPDLAPIFALAAADRLVRTGVATAGEVEVADLDIARRAEWSADQWKRAEAAGILAIARAEPEPDPHPEDEETAASSQHSQHSPAEEHPPVWWDDDEEDWRTSFPPAAGDVFAFEEHEPGHKDYRRSLTAAEAAAIGPDPYQYDEEEMADLADRREAFFAALARFRAGLDSECPPVGACPPLYSACH